MNLSDDLLSGLSAETVKALREFALQSGVSLDVNADNEKEDLIQSVSKHFQIQDREEVFPINYTSADGKRNVSFSCKGVKRELGQTLSSTGLTIWRAAEHLCQYIIDHPERFARKSICELGAGLGLVSILLDKLEIADKLVVTDGDEDTIELLIENKLNNDCNFDTAYLLWGEHEDFLSDNIDGFDILMAADVIYEDDQILPLLASVKALLKPDGEFILAFARRNVPIDKVIKAAADQYGLIAEIVDEKLEGMSTEPIYSFKYASK